MASKKSVKTEKKVIARSAYGVLLKPVITEKSTILSSDRTKVVFKVRPDATKPEIKQAIEGIFNVQVAKVRTCNYIGKPKRTTSVIGRRAAFKKAYVTLKAGNTIDVVEGL